ncbi:hypothetical protein Pmani_035564 [Petrolisthes manimaculis]|uniref:Uncharacterized protein n=1 Tax=Petrolisthes manimaculis TaxID=1843537 RepID=A0AAE1NMP3_9EUCA|nr:hypothetical protein Pmani_035564 [Petrolisthes manimaculis]
MKFSAPLYRYHHSLSCCTNSPSRLQPPTHTSLTLTLMTGVYSVHIISVLSGPAGGGGWGMGALHKAMLFVYTCEVQAPRRDLGPEVVGPDASLSQHA